MTSAAGDGTRFFAVVGDPVEHSLSPAIHNAAIRDLGLDGEYGAVRCDAEQLAGVVRRLVDAGGGGNVTLPHKHRMAALVDRATEAVRATGACNTFWAEEGVLHGDNTDVAGFDEARAHLMGGPVSGARVLVLGAGGAASAVVVALLAAGVAEVLVHNRTRARGRALVTRLHDRRVRLVRKDARDLDGPFDLVVNATRIGLEPEDPLPLDPARLDSSTAVLDLVYGARGETRFVRAARARGSRAADGAEMLIRQAALSFARWWGRAPSLEVMRGALRDARSDSA